MSQQLSFPPAVFVWVTLLLRNKYIVIETNTKWPLDLWSEAQRRDKMAAYTASGDLEDSAAVRQAGITPPLNRPG